ncbi:MAG: septation protein A [Alphaproteobacteria bacterium]|nr:septation protein A [Rhodospirillales bacterium]MCW9044859.1 septation protein A [Alphaproteobacteria bacterium]
MDKKQAPGWLRPTVDYGPIVVFFAAYYIDGLFAATAAIMVTTAVALIMSYIFERRIPMMPLITAIVVGVFGGLTLWLKDDTFIKMKPTIIQAAFSIILFGGLAFGKVFLKSLMGAAWQMEDEGWRKLTVRFALFFAAMAVINEVVWRTQSTDFWVNYKVFGIMGLTMVFVLTQTPLLTRYNTAKEE